jgi:hypothetical protein
MRHTIEVARLRPDQVQRLTHLYCDVLVIDAEGELYSVKLPSFAQVGTHGRVVKGALNTVRHSAVIPLDKPGRKEAPPTMFKRVVWVNEGTDEEPARIVGMALVKPVWAAA